jgi:DNA-binding CsgD family transcriptional regulator
VSTLELAPTRLERARALVELGSALRRTGSRRESREILRSGLDAAHTCDADALVARAEDELRASGARLVKRPVSGLGALTPSEVRTARLAALGLSNAEIAQRLFLSTKTIEAHLGRSYRKLGIAHRNELSKVLTPS